MKLVLLYRRPPFLVGSTAMVRDSGFAITRCVGDPVDLVWKTMVDVSQIDRIQWAFQVSQMSLWLTVYLPFLSVQCVIFHTDPEGMNAWSSIDAAVEKCLVVIKPWRCPVWVMELSLERFIYSRSDLCVMMMCTVWSSTGLLPINKLSQVLALWWWHVL